MTNTNHVNAHQNANLSFEQVIESLENFRGNCGKLELSIAAGVLRYRFKIFILMNEE